MFGNLVDAPFSPRWDKEQTQNYDGAEQIRELFFGLPPHEQEGVRLYSISTMGSPISIYSLMMAPRQPLSNIYDITSNLAGMLKSLQQELGRRLLWQNFVHHADIIAYPLAELLPTMVDPTQKYLEVKDILISEENEFHDNNLFSHVLGGLINAMLMAEQNNRSTAIKKAGELAEKLHMALACGPAHGSYWTSQIVAHDIASVLQVVCRQPQPLLAASQR